MTHFGNCSIFIVRQRLQHNGRSAWRMPLVGHLFIADTLKLSSAFFHRPVYRIAWHTGRLCRSHGRAQAWVCGWIAPTHPGRDREIFNQFCKHLAPTGILDCLLMLNGAPFGMAGHDRLLPA